MLLRCYESEINEDVKILLCCFYRSLIFGEVNEVCKLNDVKLTRILCISGFMFFQPMNLIIKY